MWIPTVLTRWSLSVYRSDQHITWCKSRAYHVHMLVSPGNTCFVNLTSPFLYPPYRYYLTILFNAAGLLTSWLMHDNYRKCLKSVAKRCFYIQSNGSRDINIILYFSRFLRFFSIFPDFPSSPPYQSYGGTALKEHNAAASLKKSIHRRTPPKNSTVLM